MKWFLLFVLIPAIIAIPLYLYGQFTLSNVESSIRKEHPVAHISADSLYLELQGPDSSKYLLFDVRAAEEYAVSHIAGARRVDPDISAAAFLQQFGGDLPDHHLVFYCSVGKRSAVLVERLNKTTATIAALSLLNMSGSIFRWYNNGYPVVNDAGPTSDIHPYNSRWGTLLHKSTDR